MVFAGIWRFEFRYSDVLQLYSSNNLQKKNRSIISYWMFQLKFHINYEKVDSEAKKKHILSAHFLENSSLSDLHKNIYDRYGQLFPNDFLTWKIKNITNCARIKTKTQPTCTHHDDSVCKCQSECIWHWIILNGKMCLNGVD